MLDNNYLNFCNNKSLNLLYFLENKIFAPMKSKGIRGASRLSNLTKKLISSPSSTGPVIIRTSLGFSLLVDPVCGKTLERTIFYNGIYEIGTLHIIRNILKENDTFIDIGANIGLMSLTASNSVGENGQIFSFEPMPDTYDILNYNIRINQVKNIKTFNLALGSKKDSKNIYENIDGDRGCSSLVKPGKYKNSHKICIEALDNFIAMNDLKNIKCLKIDVEGWELEVLKGAINLLSGPKSPIIIIEYSSLLSVENKKILDIYNFLKKVNLYNVYKLSRGKETVSSLRIVETQEQLPVHDNLFCFLPSQIKELPTKLFERPRCF